MRNHGLRDRARTLRGDMTPAERTLWRAIRLDALGVTFRRQHAIRPYIADFACVELRLVVEVDGGQHGDARDAERDATMRDAGWIVLRFWNNEVTENRDGVLQRIGEAIAERRKQGSPHPGPPP
jgi:primosomal protein N' (replication factor Y)